jgi:hypothetical protein
VASKRKEKVMNKEVGPAPSTEEVLAAAENLTEADADAEIERLLAAPVTLSGPAVSELAPANASDIAATAAKLSEALGGEPVSQSSDPITIVEPDAPRLQVIRDGDLSIIASGDRIDVVRQLVGGDPNVPVAPVAAAPAPVNEQIACQILAEQEAGRNALARHAQRAAYFPPPPKQDTGNVEVLRPGDLSHIQQRHMLSPASLDDKKGHSY